MDAKAGRLTLALDVDAVSDRCSGEAAGALYDDDGVSFAYEKGEFRRYAFSAMVRRGLVALGTPPDIRIDEVRIHGREAVKALDWNGRQIAPQGPGTGATTAVWKRTRE